MGMSLWLNTLSTLFVIWRHYTKMVFFIFGICIMSSPRFTHKKYHSYTLIRRFNVPVLYFMIISICCVISWNDPFSTQIFLSLRECLKAKKNLRHCVIGYPTLRGLVYTRKGYWEGEISPRNIGNERWTCDLTDWKCTGIFIWLTNQKILQDPPSGRHQWR